MVSESFLYWLTRFDHIHSYLHGLCLALSIVMLVSLIIGLIGLVGDPSDDTAFVRLRGIGKHAIIICLTSLLFVNLIAAFLPTTKEMAAIYVVPKIVNNESVKEISGELLELAKDWLKELHPSNTVSKAGCSSPKT